MNHLEAIGELYVAKQAAEAEVRRLTTEYAKLLRCLANFKAGQYRPEQIVIDEVKQTWALTLGPADLVAQAAESPPPGDSGPD